MAWLMEEEKSNMPLVKFLKESIRMVSVVVWGLTPIPTRQISRENIETTSETGPG